MGDQFASTTPVTENPALSTVEAELYMMITFFLFKVQPPNFFANSACINDELDEISLFSNENFLPEAGR